MQCGKFEAVSVEGFIISTRPIFIIKCIIKTKAKVRYSYLDTALLCYRSMHQYRIQWTVNLLYWTRTTLHMVYTHIGTYGHGQVHSPAILVHCTHSRQHSRHLQLQQSVSSSKVRMLIFNIPSINVLLHCLPRTIRFSKFCLILLPWSQSSYFVSKKIWKKYQILKLNCFGLQNGLFYYIKSWIFWIFGILLYKMTPFASRQFLIIGAESSSRPF